MINSSQTAYMYTEYILATGISFNGFDRNAIITWVVGLLDLSVLDTAHGDHSQSQLSGPHR